VNEHLQRARRLISAVNLIDVRLIELHAKTVIRSEDITDDMLPAVRHWASAAPPGLKEGVFFVRANLDLRIASEINPSVASVKIQYELEYRLPDDFKASRADLAAFAKVNGVFNAWPYFREIVQAATLRMGLPPIVLPVYRVPQTTKTTPSAAPPPSKASE
jgi:preprotein translocase subunit SecB